MTEEPVVTNGNEGESAAVTSNDNEQVTSPEHSPLRGLMAEFLAGLNDELGDKIKNRRMAKAIVKLDKLGMKLEGDTRSTKVRRTTF